jgi:hypothetical protein
MALEMRERCEKCGGQLTHTSIAFVCGYECTFCNECAMNLQFICPNCKGELVRRPRQLPSDSLARCKQ